MKQETLDAMSVKELTELQARVAVQMVKAREAEKTALRGKIEELVTRSGLSVSEVFGKLRPMTGGKVAAKYCDPKTRATWTGRGRPPSWMPKNKNDWNRVAL